MPSYLPKPGSPWRSHQAVIDANPPQEGSDLPRACAGHMIVTATNGRRPFEVECDACGLEMTVSYSPGPTSDKPGRRGSPAPPPPKQDEIPF